MTSKPMVVVAGDGGVGKSSLVLRYASNTFEDTYDPTLEQIFQVSIESEDGTRIDIEIADTAGQEDFKPLRDNYLCKGSAFIIVYSIIDARSIQTAEGILEDIKALHEDEPYKLVLVGNKCDLTSKRQVLTEEGESLAKRFDGYCIETSAREDIRVGDVFRKIADMLAVKEEPEKKPFFPCCILQ